MPTLKSKNSAFCPPPQSKLKTIGITIGDPDGIGPEVTAKALSKYSPPKGVCFLVLGDQLSINKYFKSQIKNTSFFALPFSKRIRPGEKSFLFLKKAVELIKEGEILNLVTGPVSKEAIGKICPDFKGHTEFLAEQFGVKNVGMFFIAGNMRTIIVTRHIPLNKVSASITKPLIAETIELTNRSLIKDFKISKPLIGVCGINPHAGEGGRIGKEEIKTVIPAIKYARSLHINCVGPFASDTLFHNENRSKFDAIVAMYHDQGLIPIKTLHFNRVVNLTIGLPFIRTSPGHGTAFDIAGKNIANPTSMLEAIKLAVKLS